MNMPRSEDQLFASSEQLLAGSDVRMLSCEDLCFASKQHLSTKLCLLCAHQYHFHARDLFTAFLEKDIFAFLLEFVAVLLL